MPELATLQREEVIEMDWFFVACSVSALIGRFFWRLASLEVVVRKVTLLAQVFHEAAKESTELVYEDRLLRFKVLLMKKKEEPFDPHEDIYDQGKLDVGETKFFSQ